MSNVTAPGAGASLAAVQLPDGAGGGNAFKQVLVDGAGAEVLGLVTASPDANTLLGRIKALATSLASLITGVAATASADDIVAVTPSDTVALATVPKALYVTVAGNLAVKGAGGVAATIPVTVGQTVLLRARFVLATGTTATVFALV